MNQVVPDHELFDTALGMGAQAGRQAPIAIEQIKQVSNQGDLDEGLEAERQGFADGVRLRGRARRASAPSSEAQREVPGQVSWVAVDRRQSRRRSALAELLALVRGRRRR